MLRVLFIAVAIIGFGGAALIELSDMVSAQAVAPPLLAIATVPPASTPMPRLQYPREIFNENVQMAADGTVVSAQGANGAPLVNAGMTGTPSPLAAYGIITVSYDAQNPANSYALISSPHGVDMKRVQDLEDGFRIVQITDRGVMFAGGIFVPIGYSQATNPSVPAVGGPITGGSMPNTVVPVDVHGAGPAGVSTPAPSSLHNLIQNAMRPAPSGPQKSVQGVQQVNGMQNLAAPPKINSLDHLPSPQYVNPMTPVVTPSP